MKDFSENPFKKDTQVQPFGGGGENYRIWDSVNCSQCIKCERESKTEETAKCKLEFYISLGTITGTIPLWIAKEIGCEYNPLYLTVDLFDKCKCFDNGKDLPF